MTTEVTASVMIGRIHVDCAHGAPAPTVGKSVFCPSHVMVLIEGRRASWVLQECPALNESSPPARIQPHSPDYLLAAAMLGYLAHSAPEALRVAGLRGAIELAAGGEIRTGPIDRELATAVFTACTRVVGGVVTVLPGSSLTEDELRVAAASGLRIAMVDNTFKDAFAAVER